MEIYQKAEKLMKLKETQKSYDRLLDTIDVKTCFDISCNGWHRVSLPAEKLLPVIESEYDALKQEISSICKDLGIDEMEVK